MRRFFVGVAVAIALLALAAPASATTVEITVSCTGATFNYSRFPTNITSSATETVVVNSGTPITRTIQISTETFVDTISLSITGNATVTATATWMAHQPGGPTSVTRDVECGGGTDTGGTDTGGDTGTDTGGDTGTDTGGDTGTDTGGDTGTDTGGDTGTDTGGTTGTGGAEGSTTGGSGEASGELPFTGLPIWVPILLAGALLASGAFLLRRKRDDVS